MFLMCRELIFKLGGATIKEFIHWIQFFSVYVLMTVPGEPHPPNCAKDISAAAIDMLPFLV